MSAIFVLLTQISIGVVHNLRLHFFPGFWPPTYPWFTIIYIWLTTYLSVNVYIGMSLDHPYHVPPFPHANCDMQGMINDSQITGPNYKIVFFKNIWKKKRFFTQKSNFFYSCGDYHIHHCVNIYIWQTTYLPYVYIHLKFSNHPPTLACKHKLWTTTP